jgi:hypothetical protein
VILRARRQTGLVLNLVSCLLLSAYTAGAFQALAGEDPFVTPAWAAAPSSP